MQWLTDNNTTITLILAILAGLFAFIKWIDSRNQMLKNERYQKYMQLIKILSGSKTGSDISISMTEQIAAAWFLLEYKEYAHITLRILDNSDLEKMSNQPWKEFVAPQVRKLVEELKQQS